MKVSMIDWTGVHTRLVRAGWVIGWVAGALAGLSSWASGSSPDLVALRASVGFLTFVAVAVATGLLLGRSAPSVITPAQPKGALVDQVVGDEADEPEPDLDAPALQGPVAHEEGELDAA